VQGTIEDGHLRLVRHTERTNLAGRRENNKKTNKQTQTNKQSKSTAEIINNKQE